jgi:hypothetical protein
VLHVFGYEDCDLFQNEDFLMVSRVYYTGFLIPKDGEFPMSTAEALFDGNVRTWLDNRNTPWRLVTEIAPAPDQEWPTHNVHNILIEFDDDAEAMFCRLTWSDFEWVWD